MKTEIGACDAKTRLPELLRQVKAGKRFTITNRGAAIADLARRYRLSAYDASYLELALRVGLPLATLDADLAKAARKAGVKRFTHR